MSSFIGCSLPNENKKRLALFFVMLVYLSLNGQDQMIQSLGNLDEQHTSIAIANDLSFNQAGGHLQGIQVIAEDGHDIVIVSGSTNQAAYVATITLDTNPQVNTVFNLMEKPFKHAGGFQVSDHYLAVGIEDNEARDRSVVQIYDLTKIRESGPLLINEVSRFGAYERPTAGCVALAYHQDRWLCIVGNWHTKDLDFYTSESFHRESSLDLVQTVTPRDSARSDWSNRQWLSYQNINLHAHDGVLYFIGFAKNDQGVNIADLFLISERDGKYSLRKIFSKVFESNGCDFSLGTGAVFSQGKIKMIIGSDRNLTPVSNVYLFDSIGKN